MNWQEVLKAIEDVGLKLLGGLAVLVLGLILVRWIVKLIKRSKKLDKIDPLAKSFIIGLIRVLLIAVVLISAISIMGVPLTSVITLLASAGVAVSLALQGALGNFVGGMMLLILKQIRADEYIKVGEIEGTVQSVGIFYTELIAADGRHISMPNSSLTNTAIVNYTREGIRRLDLEFGVAYGADIDLVRNALLSVLPGEDGVLDAPSPQVLLNECADSSLKFFLRLWCRQEKYWELKFALTEKSKRALTGAGVEIPFPQLDVHIKDR